MGLIYVDSCLLIYVVEQHPLFGPEIFKALESSEVVGQLAISALVKAECLVSPFRKQQLSIAQEFQDSFARLTTFDVIDEDFFAAARLRARFGLKLADALHLACAQRHSCDALWTNDDRLAAASGGLAVKLITTAA